LAVAHVAASRAFHEKLGFVVTFGAEEANYLILKNGESTLGLFFIMLDTNILTFNPGSGWNGSRPTPLGGRVGGVVCAVSPIVGCPIRW
jgi:hypothetical protein